MNTKLNRALFAYVLLSTGLLCAMVGDYARVGTPVKPSTKFGVIVTDGDNAEVVYTLVNVDHNENLTPAIRAEIDRVKLKYPTATTMTREYFQGKLQGTAYHDASGKVVGYGMTYGN